MTERLHIIPLHDLREHVAEEGEECWCKPHVEEDTGLVIHNSADGREAYEIGSRKPH